MDKISVIIPVFNSEAYLEQCLESICGQTMNSIEIICVNDGSTDASLDILRRFAAIDGRIKVIEKANGGVASARNCGFDAATGEYVGFLDSDDWLDSDCFEVLSTMADKAGADIVINTSYVLEYVDAGKRAYSDVAWVTPEGILVPGVEVQRRLAPILVNCLYRRSFLEENALRFQELIAGEDLNFTGVANMSADRIFVFKGPFYHYRQRNGSLMGLKGKGFEYIKAFRMMRDRLIEKGISTNGVKLFYVESLFIDNEEIFDYVRNYMLEIRDEFMRDIDIYTDVDRFLMEIAVTTPDYETYKAHYNSNVSMSFLRARMKSKMK